MFPVIAEVKIFPSVRKAMTSVLPEASANNANPRSLGENRSGCGSELDDFAIVRGLVFDLAQAAQHVLAHVGEDDSLGADCRQVLAQNRQRKVRAHGLFVHVAFADEQVGTARGLDQGVDPFGVAGIADRPAIELDAVRETGAGPIVVAHMKRSDIKFADPIWSANCELTQGERKGEGPFAREGRCKRAFVPGCKTRAIVSGRVRLATNCASS